MNLNIKDLMLLRKFRNRCSDCEAIAKFSELFLELPNCIFLIFGHVLCMVLTPKYLWLASNAKNLAICT